MNLAKKTSLLFYYGTGILGLNKHDIVLTSFPKSGNTWIRFFLCNLISLKEWKGKTVDFEVLDNTMPELGVSNLLGDWKYQAIPRIVKTHKSYWSSFNKNKNILLLRDPKDVMVSYYKYEMGRRNKRYKGSFSEFIRTSKFGLEAWANHYTSWKDNATLILRFEDLKQNDELEFRKIVELLKIEVEDDVFLKAVEKSRFKNIKKVEVKHGLGDTKEFEDNFKFARKGKSGNWQSLFSEKDIEFYNEKMRRNNISIYGIN